MWHEPSLESVGLHSAAVRAVGHYHKRSTWFSSLRKSNIVVLCTVYVVLAFLSGPVSVSSTPSD
jgi:hypothetical protein